ncbi:MAG: ATP-binding cassette domain-containing protein [Bacteroidota bacterium]
MIKIKGIDFKFPKSQLLFNDLNLQLETGKIYGLLGKNGVGKSTLLKLINGFLFPKQGHIKVGDFDPKDRSVDLLNDIYFLKFRN